MKKMTQVPFLALFLIALNMPQNAWGTSLCCWNWEEVHHAVWYECLGDCNDLLNFCVASSALCTPSPGAPKMNKNKVKIVTKEEFEKLQQNKPGNKK